MIEIKILVETSARHVHLSQKDADILFGKSYKFNKLRDLSQPGEYATKETLTLTGNKSSFNNVRMIVPVRKESQVELSITDCYALGIQPELRLSGNLSNTPKILAQGPKGKTSLPTIVAKRHLHISEKDAKKLQLKNNQKIKIKVKGERAILFDEIIVRIGNSPKPSLHLDTDEANSAGIKGKTFGELV